MLSIIHVTPHTLTSLPEGHATRHAALREVLPYLEAAWDWRQLEPHYDLAFVELGAPVPSASKTVRIYKATNHEQADFAYDLTIPTGPYEGYDSSPGPLVRLAPEP